MLLAVALPGLFGLSGCGPEREVSRIESSPASREVNNPELGSPAVDPLSFGPGDKDSPTWSPSGGRVAFVLDGYVSDKSLSAEGSTRRTVRDLGAERVTWSVSGERLVILGESESPGSEGEAHTHPLYVTRDDEGQLKIESLTEDALAMSAPSGEGPLVAALESDPEESRISAVDASSGELEAYPGSIEGGVAEISVAPGGGRALATVISADDSGPRRYEIHTFDLESGESRRVARLPGDQEIFGAPQQTSDGIYYVAGARDTEDGAQEDIQYTLYRLPEGSGSPEPASGVGQDFIASSIKVSPDGGRVALLGRRDSGSATNLYVLDLADESLYSATNNENMEIKTGTDSLDWHPDGGSVAIVARSDVSEPEVYSGSAAALLAPFYNVYEVPVDDLREPE